MIVDFAYQEQARQLQLQNNMKDIRDTNSDEAPPNSRLFIIGAKDLTEEDFRDAFETHGTIEKVEIHRDKNGNSKGLAYIKFSKTSEAAHALEQLNGRCIGNHPRPLKVLVANNRDQNYKTRFVEDAGVKKQRILRNEDSRSSFVPSSIDIWNKLPVDIRKAENVKYRLCSR